MISICSDYDKNKESSYLQYWDVNDLYGWAYASLKPYIDLNTNLKKKAKNDFEEDFFKLMNNSVFGKAMKNLRKHGDKKLEITERRRHYLVSEPNYHKFIL